VHMRPAQNIDFNPTPDIFHDLFGHASLLVHRDFSYLLHRYAQIYAASAPWEIDPRFVYVKRLSEAKVHAADNRALIDELQSTLEKLNEEAERALLSRRPIITSLTGFGWWITEYGLIETEQGIRIYGASLLSSIAESTSCLTDAYARRRLTRSTFREQYDATSPQNALYVSASFGHVKELLRELAADAVLS
jgi:phenylalanine-4-hydroxylase